MTDGHGRFLTSHYFDKIYSQSNWWHIGRLKILRSLFKERLKEKSGLSILDIGCGSGHILKVLNAYGNVDGVDRLPADILKNIRAFSPQTRIFAGRFPAALPAGASYDVITLFDVLEHAGDDAALLRDIHRTLKPGGLLFITVPAYMFLWGPMDELNRHKRRYTRPELRRKMEAAGFRVRKLSYYNTILFPPIAAARLLRRCLPGKNALMSAELQKPPSPVNFFLTRVFASERWALRHFNFPFGASVVGVAEKDRS